MAVPYRRTGKTKKRLRRSHYKISVEGLSICSNCGALVKSHTVCNKCGYYDGKQIIKK